MTRFEQFLRARKYLGNISERSIDWYQWAFKWLVIESPDEAAFKDCILRMREAGLSPRSVNGFIIAINAYLKWCGSSLKMKRMKCEQKVRDVVPLTRFKINARSSVNGNLLVGGQTTTAKFCCLDSVCDQLSVGLTNGEGSHECFSFMRWEGNAGMALKFKPAYNLTFIQWHEKANTH